VAKRIDRHTAADQLPCLLRVEEAAAWLDCSKGVIYELARAGTLPSVRIGRLLRIPRDTLIEFAAGRRARGAA
jgi:excisionase family DNA binding protein